MKKLLIGFLVFLVSFGSISPVLTVSAMSTSTSRYQETANRTISRYVTRLENAQYTDAQILSRLTSIRTTYTQQTYLSNYRGTRKAQINSIIIALNNAIAELDTADDTVFDIFNQVPQGTVSTVRSPSTGTNPVTNNNSVNTSTSSPANTTITIPSVNNITGVSSVVINGVIKTTLNTQNQNSFYKEYDVYLYTPNSKTNNQPTATVYIPKPENLIYNSYASYTITTNYQSETDNNKVKNIRAVAEQQPRVAKYTKTLTPNALYNIFGPLTDDQFTRDAELVVSTGISNYATYLLYVAKDNSEAFTLNYVQSGKKKTAKSNMTINASSIAIAASGYSTSIRYSGNLYSTYKVYTYTPEAGSAIIHPVIVNAKKNGVNNFGQAIGNSSNPLYGITGYNINTDDINQLTSLFMQQGVDGGRVNPNSPNVSGGFDPFYYNERSLQMFNKQKMADSVFRMYRLLVSVDNPSEAYLTEYNQVYAY